MARGVRRADAKAVVDLCPIADGGEGTVDAMMAATGGTLMNSMVYGPLGKDAPLVSAKWGLFNNAKSEPCAVVEMAAAAGLEITPLDRRNPLRTTTAGVGMLLWFINHQYGVRHITLGIGGSATNDGGCGAAQAMGVKFYDHHGVQIERLITGADLPRIARIDVSSLAPAMRETELLVACDVRNPMTGPQGAAHVYGPQKGASPDDVRVLDDGLRHLAKLFREQLGSDVEQFPGAGAAGGMGGGLMAMLGATLRPGVGLVLEGVGFSERVHGCDLCLTGEGKLDAQSMSGKACLGVAQAALVKGVPTVALVGVAGAGAQAALSHGLAGFRVIGEGLPAAESIRRASELLEAAAFEEVRQRMR